MQGMVSMIMSIARQEGAVGLFRGLGPTIITNAPYSAFYYLFYTSLKERLQQVRQSARRWPACRLAHLADAARIGTAASLSQQALPLQLR